MTRLAIAALIAVVAILFCSLWQRAMDKKAGR